jgi:hypothetical protein
VRDAWAAQVAQFKAKGWHVCEELDPDTSAPCHRVFKTAKGLREHCRCAEAPPEQGATRKRQHQHRSRQGHSSRDEFKRMATSNGHFARGTLPNRSAASAAPTFVPGGGAVDTGVAGPPSLG